MSKPTRTTKVVLEQDLCEITALPGVELTAALQKDLQTITQSSERRRGGRREDDSAQLVSDDARAAKICEAMGDLQQALDEAVMSGLDVELEFKKMSNRFASVGVDMDSLVGAIRISRQLV